MNTVLRTCLSALAVLSFVVFCNPAVAGMIATPRADRESAEARAAALERAAARLPADAEGLRALPTSDLLLLAYAPESAFHAANDALILLVVLVSIVLFVGLVVTLVIISKVKHWRRPHIPHPPHFSRLPESPGDPAPCR